MSNKKMTDDLEKFFIDKIVNKNISFAQSSASAYKMPVYNNKVKYMKQQIFTNYWNKIKMDIVKKGLIVNDSKSCVFFIIFTLIFRRETF